MKCGLVTPMWVQIGWVQWHGSPTPEKLFSIERVTCKGDATVDLVESGGLKLRLCAEHAKEVEAGKLFTWKGPESP